MSLDASIWAWKQRVKRSAAKLVLLSIADRAGENNTAFPSISRIAYDTELDRKTVMSCIAYLIEQGMIDAEKAHGISTRYRLIGVVERNETSTKIGTGPKNGTSTKNGTAPVPKLGLPPVPKLGHEPISRTYQEPIQQRERENSAAMPRASRLSLSALPDEWSSWASQERPELVANLPAIWQHFRDYWLSQPNDSGMKADWPATWRNWIRRERTGESTHDRKTVATDAGARKTFSTAHDTPIEDIPWMH